VDRFNTESTESDGTGIGYELKFAMKIIKGLSKRGEWEGEMEIGSNEIGVRLLLNLDYKSMES
jgi:hypothetical protein